MSVIVSYPVEIRQYQVSLDRSKAEIILEGVECAGNGDGASGAQVRRVGIMVFGDPNPIGDKDFITRGGFLRMDRPLDMLPAALDILRNEQPVYLLENGTLSTSMEPVGEGEN